MARSRNSGGGGRQPLMRRVDDLTDLANACGRLTRAMAGLAAGAAILVLKVSALAAVVGGVLVTGQEPVGLPAACGDEVLILEDLSVTAAANELFWNAHPTLNRREIMPHEQEFAREWWVYYWEVKACRSEANSPQ